MTNAQMYIAIGISCFTMLATLIASVWQSNNVLSQLNLRFASLEREVTQRIGMLEQDIKTVVRVTNDLDNRLARLEERLAR